MSNTKNSKKLGMNGEALRASIIMRNLAKPVVGGVPKRNLIKWAGAGWM